MRQDKGGKASGRWRKQNQERLEKTGGKKEPLYVIERKKTDPKVEESARSRRGGQRYTDWRENSVDQTLENFVNGRRP